MDPIVSNVKIHFKLSEEVNHLKKLKNLKERWEVKWHSNFVVIRARFVYIAYFSSNHINATGLKSELDISSSLAELCEIYEIKSELFSNAKIDNITSSGSFNRKIKLNVIRQNLKEKTEEHSCSFNYNKDHFPGAFLKFFSHSQKVGTAIIFNSGKYSIVGAKCASHTALVFSRMQVILRDL